MHCGQYHIGTNTETVPGCYVFLLSHIHRLSVCKEDFSLALEMTIRDLISLSRQSPQFKYPHRMAAGAGCIFGVFGMV